MLFFFNESSFVTEMISELHMATALEKCHCIPDAKCETTKN